MIDNTAMLAISDQIHIVLVKTDPSGDSTIVTSHYLDWRPVLAAPNSRCGITLELMCVGMYNNSSFYETESYSISTNYIQLT